MIKSVSSTSSPTVRQRPAWGIIGAAGAFTLVWFALLAGRPLFEPDEGRYAEIPREMAAGGSWIVPHLDGLVYLEKPPLQYWLTAMIFRVAGENEFTARFTTGLAGYCCLALVFWVAYRLWGVGAACKALLLTAASGLFVMMGHQLTLDMLLCASLLAALGCFLMAESSADRQAWINARRWMLACWTSMAFAVLSKGLIGAVLPAGSLLIYAAWQRDRRIFRRLHARSGLALFGLIAAPWFVLAALANPAFLKFFFVREHFQRFLTPVEHRTEPWWFFVPVLAVGVLPWLPQAIRALALPLRTVSTLPLAFDPRRLLWSWCAFVLVFFSASNAKLIPYILPSIPALALLCAAPGDQSAARRDLIGGALLSLAAGVGIVVYSSGRFSAGAGHALAVHLAPRLMPAAAMLSAVGAGTLLLAARNRAPAALILLCCGWFACAAEILVAARSAADVFSAKGAALALQHAAASTAPIFSVQTYEQSLPFYLRREVTLVDYRDELTLGLSQQPDKGIESLDRFVDRWSALDQAFAIMPHHTHNDLATRGVPMRLVADFPNAVVVSRR
ncbi:MAG: glycosyltransferase family 39 protein [Steroidobacteraceae bacterium]